MITTIFFDLGDSLGVPVLSLNHRLERFERFDFAVPTLEELRAAGKRTGVISNTGDERGPRMNEVLEQAGLLEFFEPPLLIYSGDVGLRKDSPAIFQLAARKAGLEASPEQCLFVGENAEERAFALQAGWQVCPHPQLVSEVLAEQALRYARIEIPAGVSTETGRNVLRNVPLVPLLVEGQNRSILYALTSERAVARLMNAQCRVTLLGDKNTPGRTDLYLLRDDQAKESGFANEKGESAMLFEKAATALTVLESGDGRILIALPPEVPLDSIHFEGARHGHTLRLTPNPRLLDEAGPLVPAAFAAGFGEQAPPFTAADAAAWALLTDDFIKDCVERFSGARPLRDGSDILIRSRHVLHDDNQVAVDALAKAFNDLAPGRLEVSLHQFSHLGRSLFNVVAQLKGESADLVLVTAHLDSVAQHSDPRHAHAPGADDDMSGCAGVIAIAERFLALFPTGSQPARTVQFVLFNDEENGLVGSQAYARHLASSGAGIAGVFQMDMIGFDKAPPSTWEVHVGFSPSPELEAKSRVLADLIATCREHVAPALPVPQIIPNAEINPDPAEQRSDHGSFHHQGYPACCVSEAFFTGEGNPAYHQKEDVSASLNWTYASAITRAIGAAAWALARQSPANINAFAAPTPMKRELDTRNESHALFGNRVPARASALKVPNNAFNAAAGLPAAQPAALAGTPIGLIEKALSFVQGQEAAAAFGAGFAPAEPAAFVPDPVIQRTSSGSAAVHLQQHYRGIPVFEAAATVRFDPQGQPIDAPGETVSVSGLNTEPVISAIDAVSRAVAHLAETGEGEEDVDEFGQVMRAARLEAGDYTPQILTSFNMASRPTVLTPGPLARPVPAHLVVFAQPERPRLAWHVLVTFPGEVDQYVILVAADEAPGEILYAVSTLHHMRGQGNVFEFNPGIKDRALVPFPRPVSDYPAMPSTPLTGFPADWVASGRSSGNTTHATLGESPTTLAGQLQNGVAVFNPTDPSGDDQKMLNIFYFCNYMHDFLFILGFDEAAGNFQQVNFTHTGLGNDAVLARAHSRAVDGTANMLTHPDGQPPVMNMGLVVSTDRHTAFDSDVVFHEYVHGLTNRLVGGPLNAQALRRPQSRGMGEGWSDYYALTVTSFVTGIEKIVSGDWVTGEPGGIRTAPYDDNYPVKYGGIKNLGGVHSIGEVWCATLMMMTRKARAALGSNEDGYRVCWQIVTDGLKLVPANPSFLQARDGILMALDQLRDVNRVSQQTHRLVRRAAWEAFAHFEMGVNAQSANAELQGIVPDTTLPANL